MKIVLRQPLAFSEIGLKDNQEDSLYPNPLNVKNSQPVFLMCDGMGGHEHGEVASRTVASSMGEYLEQNLDSSDLAAHADPKSLLESALQVAYSALDEVDSDDSGKKMGTTMTCLCLSSNGALMAHIGDSRIYHIRPSLNDASTGRKGIRNVTSDHSLVNDLLKAGELTPEEAQNYPHKNIITRAMQPHQERRAKADVNLESDIQPGDYFFLCCDGVLEQLTDSRLCEILAMPISDRDKLSLIKAECDGRTKDNYTAWLIPVDNVIIDEINNNVSPSDDVIQAVSDDEDTIQNDNQEIQSNTLEVSSDENDNSKIFSKISGINFKKIIIALGIIVSLILCLFALMKYFNQGNEDNAEGSSASSFLQWSKPKSESSESNDPENEEQILEKEEQSQDIQKQVSDITIEIDTL